MELGRWHRIAERRHAHGHMHRHQQPKAHGGHGRKIVLVGNPNVGKSVIFSYLTGIYAEVSNYPGTTIEIMKGKRGDEEIIDTPGIYGVSSFNDEERVARDIILEADIVVNVVDSVHLERDLFLTLQLIDMGFPMLVALNFMDEAENEGIEIDVDLLSDLLGVPVIQTSAVNGKGLDELAASIEQARPGIMNPKIVDKVNWAMRIVGTRREAILLLEGDEVIAEKHGVDPLDFREEMYILRRERVNDIIGHVVKETPVNQRFSVKLGRFVLHPFWGIVTLVIVLFIMYEAVGVFVAQTVVGFTEDTIMRQYWEPMARRAVYSIPWAAKGTAIGEVLVGQYGVFTMAITYLVGLLFPLVLGFYLMLSLLEDSGYLPRLATLTDRLLSTIGLNGRAVVPIILGFGCITMATVTTRLLGTEREKTIASAVINFAIPCSAQLAVIVLLLGRAGFPYVVAYIFIVGAVFALVGTILNKFLPGESSSLLINLPPMRLPRINNVIRKSVNRSLSFMKEAFPWFMIGSLAVAILHVSGYLYKLQLLFQPITVHWLQLPREAANAFIMGMVRRDFGAVGFLTMPLTPAQTLVAMVSMTLFVPCIASVAILLKERSVKEGAMIWLGSWVVSFTVGGIVSQIVIR